MSLAHVQHDILTIHVPCVAHVSNAPAIPALDAVDRIVKYLKTSNDNSKGLDQLLTSMGAPQNPKIIQVAGALS